MKPKRIQRKRSKGWTMPPNTVYVGRPGKWGNPFLPKEGGIAGAISAYRAWLKGEYIPQDVGRCPITFEDIQKELGGKNLACWCKEGEPCHADVLLEIANY